MNARQAIWMHRQTVLFRGGIYDVGRERPMVASRMASRLPTPAIATTAAMGQGVPSANAPTAAGADHAAAVLNAADQCRHGSGLTGENQRAHPRWNSR